MLRKYEKYRRAPFAYGDIVYRDHPWIGIVWHVQGTSLYEVEMTDCGFTCTCKGFGFQGKCKHIDGVGSKFEAPESCEA
jgi:hypothetical protein